MAIYKSSESGKRFEKTMSSFTQAQRIEKGSGLLEEVETVKVNGQIRYQEITGFGAAFTDSAGINLEKLSLPTRKALLESYFGKSGLQYSTARVPMASCDFSTHEYSYDDVENDFDLRSFNLTIEDYKYKIPYILQALTLTRGNLKLIASPWSAPGWMKTNGRMKGGGKLKGELGGAYYITWANYFIRFLEAYQKSGVRFWGVTAQNEPTSGADPDYHWQTMFFNAETQRDFIKKHLGPTLQKSELGKDVALIILDDQRFFLPHWADVVLDDDEAAKYVSGIGVHWYEDFLFAASRLSETHKRHPDKFILATEACNGYTAIMRGPVMGSWARGENYVHSIIEDLQNWATGWTDWNLCLDTQGGPTWVSNFVDAPIIVNTTVDEFYKQPMFYAMGHFSKFVRPGSARIGLNLINRPTSPIEGIAFTTPTQQRVLILSNRNDEITYNLSVEDAAMSGKALQMSLEPRTIATVVWNKHKL